MKCAAEMAKELMIVQKQKAQEKAHREYEKRLKMNKNSIDFCETEISQALQEAIGRGQNHCYICLSGEYSVDANCHTVHRLCPGRTYANGTKGYNRYGEPMCLSTIKQYLEDRCFKVTIYKDTFMEYGRGEQRKFDICISLPSSVPCQ